MTAIGMLCDRLLTKINYTFRSYDYVKTEQILAVDLRSFNLLERFSIVRIRNGGV